MLTLLPMFITNPKFLYSSYNLPVAEKLFDNIAFPQASNKSRSFVEEEAPRNTYDPKPWRDVRRAAETDQLEEQLAEAKEQAESWRRMALHLMERSA